MTGPRAAALIGGVSLLERAISYTLGSLLEVRPELMSRPTPCSAWDLRALLVHMNDSLLALHEAARIGRIGPEQSTTDGDLVGLLRQRACLLVGAWSGARVPGPVFVAGSPLTTGIVTGAGALEVTVHGWDVALACGQDRPIPAALAEELLELAPFFVDDVDRPARFAPRVAVCRGATTGDRLLAFVGRRP